MTQLSGKDLDIAVGLANGWTIRPDEFNSGRWILPDGSDGMLVDVYKSSSNWHHCEALVSLMDEETKRQWGKGATLRAEVDFPLACRLYVEMKSEARTREIEIDLPPIPEIPSFWAYVIPQSFLSAL